MNNLTEKFIFVNEGNIVKLGTETIYQYGSFNDAWTFAKLLGITIEDNCQGLKCQVIVQSGNWILGENENESK